MIRKSHPKFKLIDTMCFNSKNLYNEANYELRQQFIKTGKHMSYREMNFEYKTHENYKSCFSQPANCTIRLLHKNWKSFEVANRDYEKHPEKYLGRPKIPRYLDLNGRFPWMIPNNTCFYDYDKSEIHFGLRVLQGYHWESRCLGRLIQVRFVPKGTCYVMEVVYEIKVPDVEECIGERIAAIDLGVNNLMTITNNIGQRPIIVSGKVLKSINQFYNKRISKMQSDLANRNGEWWSKRMHAIAFKRQNRIRDYMHKSSAFVVKWCVENGIDTLVVGKNKSWKQKQFGMQNFKYISHDTLLHQLQYKCQDAGICYIETDEPYTSGTSFLDCEPAEKEFYDVSRRIKRGLFQSGKGLINADVNGSLQIMTKVFPNAFRYGIEVCLTPVVINMVKTM